MNWQEKRKWLRFFAKLIATTTTETDQNEIIFGEMGYSWWSLEEVDEGRAKFAEAFEEIFGVPFDEAGDITIY